MTSLGGPQLLSKEKHSAHFKHCIIIPEQKPFIPNTKYIHLRKKHLSREAMQMFRNKQRLWKAYKRTGKVEDYTKYKDALKETQTRLESLNVTLNAS